MDDRQLSNLRQFIDMKKRRLNKLRQSREHYLRQEEKWFKEEELKLIEQIRTLKRVLRRSIDNED